MNENEDPRRSLQSVFDSCFYSSLGLSPRELPQWIELFYDTAIASLINQLSLDHEAVAFVEWAFARGFCVAVAADPLVPKRVTEYLVRSAGLEPDRFELISSSEQFHFSMTHSEYFAELLGLMGWKDGPLLTVGSVSNRALLAAERFGLKTYQIEADANSRSGLEARRGTYSDLRDWLDSVDLSTLEPNLKTRESVMAMMASTPAVFHTLVSNLRAGDVHAEPAEQDWSIAEILCHLRDTEREVHQPQLKALLEKDDVFIPRPDTAVWANGRNYSREDGVSALNEFTNVRMEILSILKNIEPDLWQRKARHAIFGPTDFLEIMSFVADHDRLHLQQARDTAQKLRVGVSN